MTFITVIILSSILISFSNEQLQQRPMFFIHGLGDSCTGFEEEYKFDDFFCIESGAGKDSWRFLTTQIDKACERITELIKLEGQNNNIEKIGFYLIGFSQGGLIARGIFHKCTELRPLVKGIFTIGTPNLGIDKIPPDMIDRGNSSYLQSTINYFANKIFTQVSSQALRPVIGPLEYVNRFRSVPEDSEDISKIVEFDSEMSAYTKYLNFNEAIKDPRNAGHVLLKTPSAYLSSLNEEIGDYYYDNLDLMINFTFLKDEMIDPIPSQTFGAIFNEHEKKIQEFSKTRTYTENFMGLRSLYDKSKLINCAIEGSHFSFSIIDFKNLFLILSVEECNQISENKPSYKDYNECLEYMLQEYSFLETYKCDRATLNNIDTTYILDTNQDPQHNSQKNEEPVFAFSFTHHREREKIHI